MLLLFFVWKSPSDLHMETRVRLHVGELPKTSFFFCRTCLVAAAVSEEEAARAVYIHEAAVGRYGGEKKEIRCCRMAEFIKTHQMKACKMAAVQETGR